MKFLVTESQYKLLLKEQSTTSTASVSTKTGGGNVGKTTQQTKPQQPATNKDDSGISYQDYLKTRGNIPTYNYQDSLRANTKVMTPTTTPVPSTKPNTPQTQQPQQSQQTAQKPTQQPQQDFVKLNMGYLYKNGSKMLNDLPQGMDRFDFMTAKKELYGYLQNWRDTQKQPTTKLSPEATALYNTIQRLTNDLPQNQKTELSKTGGEMNQVPG